MIYQSPEERLARFTSDGSNFIKIQEGDGEEIDFSSIPGWAADADDSPVEVFEMHGLPIGIETPKGEIRSGFEPISNSRWETIMPADYGFIEGFVGADGDSLDCYVGPNRRSRWVFVVDQRHLPELNQGFDEHKVMLGFDDWQHAMDAYVRGHHRAGEVLMDWTPMNMADFKRWLKSDKLDKPVGDVKR